VHDYIRGAYQALTWVRELLRDSENIDYVIKDIENAIDDINHGVAVDFRWRIKNP